MVQFLRQSRPSGGNAFVDFAPLGSAVSGAIDESRERSGLEGAGDIAREGGTNEAIANALIASKSPKLQVVGLNRLVQAREAETARTEREEIRGLQERRVDIAEEAAKRGSFGVDSFGRVFNKRTGELRGTPTAAGPGGTIPNRALLGKSLSPGEKKVDENFAKEFVSFNAAGGFADVEKNLGQLEAVAERLEKGEDLTGPIIGLTAGTTLGDILEPTAAAAREAVEEVVQRNLRVVLGAQFTQKEGDRLIARAFNPRLGEAENAKRVRRLVEQIKAMAQQKAAAVEHFRQFGTLRGFQGKLPSFSDFPLTPAPRRGPQTKPINRFRIIN